MAMTLTQDDIDAIAAAILVTPGQPIATDASGRVDLVDAPNATAVAAIQSGLATPTNITAASGVALAGTQGAVTFGQVKIVATVGGQGALDVVNNHNAGYGMRTSGSAGQYNVGTTTGQFNQGSESGQNNYGQYGQLNYGTDAGQYNLGDAGGVGILAAGGAGEVTPMWAEPGADGDTLKSLSDQMDAAALEATAQEILEDTGTTIPGLMAAELSNTSDSTASGAITRTRGNSWTINATIGAITGYTSLWFTVKHSQDDADSDAILQIKLNSTGSDDDLLYVNGATASDSTLGTITVSDASTGAIIIAVDETVTDDMPAGAFYYDVQVLNSGTVTTPDSGTFTITADVTRSIA